MLCSLNYLYYLLHYQLPEILLKISNIFLNCTIKRYESIYFLRVLFYDNKYFNMCLNLNLTLNDCKKNAENYITNQSY
jgi:hypothetical protein